MKLVLNLTFFFLISLKFTTLFAIENRIIVKVNNEIITSYDLKQTILTTLILANQQIDQKIVDQSKSTALKALINSILKKKEVNKYNIKLSEIEINNQLKNISGGDIIKFKNRFKTNNLDFSLYEDKLKTELMWRKLIFNIYQEKVKINEEEIQNELSKLKKNKKLEEYRISEISVSFSSEDEKLDLIRKINNQIIKFGFEETALKLSESSSAVDKGDLGWVNVNGLTKKISAIILKMKINEVSEPILIGNSLLFIKLKDKKISNILESKKDKLKEQIINSKKNELFNLYSTSHLSKIRNNSIIQYQ
tara:strand:+ start:262 stop:1182 length:921 start_codon:yes stop_codon:yes gene_type:complete